MKIKINNVERIIIKPNPPFEEDKDKWPNYLIGLVQANNIQGTGCLVAEDIVLTAAENLFDDNGNLIDST